MSNTTLAANGIALVGYGFLLSALGSHDVLAALLSAGVLIPSHAFFMHKRNPDFSVPEVVTLSVSVTLIVSIIVPTFSVVAQWRDMMFFAPAIQSIAQLSILAGVIIVYFAMTIDTGKQDPVLAF